MSESSEASTPIKEQIGGFLHRLFDRGTGDHSSPSSNPLNLEDIQGIILRSYRLPIVRHFLLKVNVPAAARKLLGRLVERRRDRRAPGHDGQRLARWIWPGPADDPAAPPRTKPDYCLNLGITWPGLLALEVGERVPEPLVQVIQRVRRRSRRAGGIGRRYRSKWTEQLGRRFRTGVDHIVLTLHAAHSRGPDRLTATACPRSSTRLSSLEEISRHDGMALMEMQNGKPVPVPKVHFGYIDGISMTTIRGGPERYKPDHQSRASLGCSYYSTRLRITSCPSRPNWAAMAALPCSR